MKPILKRRFTAITVALGIVIFIGICLLNKSCTLKVHFIDVGKGDSILIETPNAKYVLVDTGNLITGFKVVQYLRRHNIHRLESVIFTHPHIDHIGGAFIILQEFGVKKIFDNAQPLINEPAYADTYYWYSELVRKDKRYKALKAGDSFSLDNVIFRIIWPPAPLPFEDINSNSLVIMVEYKNFKALLAADADTFTEERLLGSSERLKADVLKLGYHGSPRASSQQFLKAVMPRVSIISVDKDNIKSYPSDEIIKRLKDIGTIIYRTDTNGDILISVTKKGQD